MSAVALREVYHAYGNREVLHGITFQLEPGEILGYLGPNGSGKTTTIRLILGMFPPSRGTIEVCGLSVPEDPLKARKKIGYLPESGAVYEHLTPREFFEFLTAVYEIDPPVARQRYHEMMETWGLLSELDTPMQAFSRGMQQKVLLTACLLHDPPVLLLDEPLSGLDVQAALIFRDLLRELRSRGKAILYSSHLLEVVERLCDRVVILLEGRIAASGDLPDLLQGSDLETYFRQVSQSSPAWEETQKILDVLG